MKKDASHNISNSHLNSQAILEFWFGAWPFDAQLAKAQSSLWFSSSAEIDEEIRSKFQPEVEHQLKNEPNFHLSSDEQLATILLTDQFTRNIYRKQAKAFSADYIAMAYCQNLIKQQLHLAYPSAVAAFLCMPLQHSEDPQVQAQSIEVFTQIADHASAEEQESANGYLKFAKLHADIINQFGRFPHRNAVLGREPTPEEEAYLEHGQRFGQ